MPVEFAPIVVFAYRRPDHLQRCLESLLTAPEAQASPLVIFCDGPRGDFERDAVERTRGVARSTTGFASVQVVEAEHNQGLATSVIEGVTRVLQEHESVVVVEDDLLVSEDFLAYMNQGLALYRDDDRVASIHGFLPTVHAQLPQSFFLRGADCWGWATWRRAWVAADWDGPSLLARLRVHPNRERFDFGGAYPYLQMLQDQVDGKVDSWAIRWYASTFLSDLYTLHPGASLVTNIGMEGSGTHAGVIAGLRSTASRIDLPLREVPVVDNPNAVQAIAQALRTKPRVRARVGGLMRRLGLGR